MKTRKILLGNFGASPENLLYTRWAAIVSLITFFAIQPSEASPLRKLEGTIRKTIPASHASKAVVGANIALAKAKAEADAARIAAAEKAKAEAEKKLLDEEQQIQLEIERGLVGRIKDEYSLVRGVEHKVSTTTLRTMRRILLTKEFDFQVTTYPNYIFIEIEPKFLKAMNEASDVWLELVVFWHRTDDIVQFRFEAAEKRLRVREAQRSTEKALQDIARAAVIDIADAITKG